jgi:O-antigen/teichoic acid export membrane protein
LVRNTTWLVAQPLALNVISLASTGFIARQLGGEGFAEFNIGLAFAMMFSPLTNMGLRALTVRHIAAHRDQAASHLGTVMSLRLALAMVAVVIVLVAAPLASASPVTRQVAMVGAGTLLLNTMMGVLTDGFHALEQMGKAARAAMWGGIVVTAASVAAAAFGGGPVEVAASYLAGPAATAAALWWQAGALGIRPRWHWDLTEFRRLLTEALPFFGQGLLESVASRLDLFILTRTIGEAGLGGYTAAGQLVSRAAIVVDGSGTALLPALSRMRATKDPAIVPTVRGTLLWLLLLAVPLAIGTAIAAPTLLRIVYGSKFLDGAPVLSIMMFTLPITAVAVVLGHGLFAAGRNREVVTSSMTSTSVTSLAIIPATIGLGVLGAPLVRVLGRSLLVLLRRPQALRDYPGLWRRTETWHLLAATMPVVLTLGIARLTGGSVGMVILAGALGSAGWVATLWYRDLLPVALLRRLRLPPRHPEGH